jgi:hypothetical protein
MVQHKQLRATLNLRFSDTRINTTTRQQSASKDGATGKRLMDGFAPLPLHLLEDNQLYLIAHNTKKTKQPLQCLDSLGRRTILSMIERLRKHDGLRWSK